MDSFLGGSLFSQNFDEIVPSTPDEIASLSSDLLIEGYVNALSGQVVLSEIDLHIRAAQDLTLKRTYIPPYILGRYADKKNEDKVILSRTFSQFATKGWVVLPHLVAGYNSHSHHFQLRDPGGYVLEFALQNGRGVLQSSSYGCSNLHLEEFSGEIGDGLARATIESRNLSFSSLNYPEISFDSFC